MYALLDQMTAAVGMTLPEYQWVYALAIVLVRAVHLVGLWVRACTDTGTQVVVNSLCYVILLHILYALLLGRLAGVPAGFGAAPAAIDRALDAASQ